MRHVRRLLLLTAFTVALLAAQPALAGTREYWVAAVPQAHWNIVPNGQDALTGMQFDPVKTTLDTVVYRRFTPHWRKMLPAEYGGIPGPTIHARVGDVVLVHFLNLDLNTPHSMHFHGVHYAFPSDGSYIPGFSGPGANVKPGKSFTYRLVAGPDSVGVWPYHDHSPSMMDSIQGGMYGALSILGRRERAPDREFVVFLESMGGFMTIDGRAFIGNTPVFPAPKDPSSPCSADLLGTWLRKAYELAEITPQPGGMWHTLPRKWATERKGYPVKDVAAAGGWKDEGTMLKSYQQADPETIRNVVLHPTHRRASQ